MLGLPIEHEKITSMGWSRMMADGLWGDDICKVARRYFEGLFKSNCNENAEHVLRVIPRCITDKMNSYLMRSVEDKEMMATLDQMDPKKALGSDGLLGLFFKENWNTIGKDVLNFCKDMLTGIKTSVKSTTQ